MSLSKISRPALIWCVLSAGLWAAPALAQDNPAPAKPRQAGSVPADGNEIIVTGRAGTAALKKVQASYAISTISNKELQMRAPIGIGEALKQVPGFYIENSSGEASGNVRVRGIPGDGWSSVALLEDGLPVQGDAGLGWLNADQSFRMDQTVDHIEVVRGGPSSIFYSNAPGAAINVITRRGTDHFEGQVRYELDSWGDNRIDAYVGGPIGKTDWRYFIGGYYRIGHGQRDAGYVTNKGGQIRATLSRDFDNGSVMFGVKRIDERIPNWGGGIYTTDADGNIVSVAGFNAKRDTITSSALRNLTFETPDGDVDFDAAGGTHVKLTQITFEGKLDFAPGIQFQQRMRYRSSWTKRSGITPYSVGNASDVLSSLYGSYVGSGQSLGAYYADGTQFDTTNGNGNGLLLVDLARTHTVPLNEFINDSRFLVSGDFLGHHDISVGFYFANEDEQYQALSAAVLSDVTDNARPLDVYLLDSSGNKLYQFTNGGIVQYGSEWNNARGTSQTTAVYASDEWQITPRLRFDGGLRWERIHIDGEVEGTQTAALDGDTAAELSTKTGNGVFTPFSHNYQHVAWTIGGNYQFQPDLGLFLRYTRAFRLPSVASFITNASNTGNVQTMNFLEGGLKFSHRNLSVYLTGFRSIYNSYEIDNYEQDASGTYNLKPYYGDTRTWGAELEGSWAPVNWFDIHASWTWQDARFTSFVYTDSSGDSYDYSHNRLIRTPKNVLRVTPGFNLLRRKLRLESDVTYNGQRWADVANSVNLPAYWQVDINIQYQITPRLKFNAMIDNVTNTLGLVNGNPRAGTIQNSEAGDYTFIGSSLYGRSGRFSLTYKF